MKLLIFSDSHCRTELMNKLAEKYKSVINGIIHLGDCTEDVSEFFRICSGIPIYQVRGNNDFDNGYPAEKTINVCGRTIFMTHGHKHRVYYDTTALYYSALQSCANIALFGHTHVPYLQNEGGIIIMNPGSVSLPRSSTGKTFAFLTFEGGKTEAAIMCADDNNIKKLLCIHI